MSSRAVEIRDLLVAAGVGTFNYQGNDPNIWSIVVGKRPDKPNRCIVCYDSGGLSPNPRWLVDYPRVQVIVRGGPNDYAALAGGAGTSGKVDDVVNALLGIDSQVINGDNWVSVTLVGDRNFIGYESNDRPMFSLNFQLIINPATGTHRESC